MLLKMHTRVHALVSYLLLLLLLGAEVHPLPGVLRGSTRGGTLEQEQACASSHAPMYVRVN